MKGKIKLFEKYKDVVTVDEIMEMLNIGRTSVYTLLNSNQIRHVKVGRKYIIPKKAVIGFLDGMCYNEPQIMDGRLPYLVSKGANI